jgi:hypothetical protein
MHAYDGAVSLLIAVELSSDLGDIGDLFADARAFEAAGADTIWLAPQPGLDPWPVLGAFAALTNRVRIASICAPNDDRLPERSRTMSLLSGGRFVLGLDAAATAHESSARGWSDRFGSTVFAVAPNAASAAHGARSAQGLLHMGDEESAAAIVAAARAAEPEAKPVECWMLVTLPTDAEAWRATCAAYTALGVTGVVLPGGPRSLDLVRNPDRVDDRSDLRLALG